MTLIYNDLELHLIKLEKFKVDNSLYEYVKGSLKNKHIDDNKLFLKIIKNNLFF